jgi:hypothetical protein
MSILNLVGGYHPGPLFIPRLRRPPRDRRSGWKEVQGKHCRAMPPWVDPALLREAWKESRR